MLYRKIYLLIAGLICFNLGSYSQQSEDLIIKANALIDGKGKMLNGPVSILISGQKIISIGKSSEVKVPSGTKIIDLKGHTLLPGFIDTHTHLASIDNDGGDLAALK